MTLKDYIYLIIILLMIGEVMFKSADKAEAKLKEIADLVLVSPFTLEQGEEAAKVLFAFGIEAEKLLPTMKILGDVSAGTGKDFFELSRIFGQVKTAGKAFTQDMNQLAVAGIPIWTELAKVMNTTPQAIRKMVEEGKVKFKDVYHGW